MEQTIRIKAVILDTNILIRDYKITSYGIRKLKKTKDLYSFDLCIPEVVYDECVGNYVTESKLRTEALNKAIEKINEIIQDQDSVKKEPINQKIGDCVKKYKTRLRRFIRESKSLLLAYPKTTHKHIIEKIYEKNQPFNNEKYSEKGYKDFLIIESIRDYIKKTATTDRIILVTNNTHDFIERNTTVEKNKLTPIASNFNLKSVYVTESLPVLFHELTHNLKGKSKNPIPGSADALSETIEKSIKEDFMLQKIEVFGINTFDTSINEIKCTIKENFIEIDENSDILEASGIFNLSITCSFDIDNYDTYHLDKEFPFLNEIDERIKSKKLSKNDLWVERFNDLKYNADFIFNYIDFHYKKNNFPKKIDPAFLSISKI